ncbi:MAG: Zn(2+)-responsive transcriptional regulator [Pseudomonadota bacterium]|nr:Zn(2+)-responsive transcriptional regulator [Pseudomonadota bacterium]
MLKISELAGRIGLSAHTIRLYEKHGLIEASERSESGYLLYSTADVNRAEFVKTARNIGFSLEDIAQLLSIRLDRSGHSCQEVTDITRNKLNEVNRKMAELEAMQKVLSCLLDYCDGGLEKATHCTILDVLDNGGIATTVRVN